MNIKQLTDSIYLIPILLEHFEKPTVITKSLLREYGINDQRVEEFRRVKSLLQYHANIVQDGWKPNYNLLREGLKEYFRLYLSQVFNLINLTNMPKGTALDYGCGSGQIGKQFEKDNPSFDVYFLDKDNPNWMANLLEVDFEQKPDWHNLFVNFFDVVIMSELLHCKGLEVREYLINSAHKILKPGGKFIVIENVDYAMAYRINKIKGFSKANVITPFGLMNLTIDKFTIKTKTNIFQHQIYVYEKI